VCIVANLWDLRNRITAAVALVNRDMLTRVWDNAQMSAVSAKVEKLSICELVKKFCEFSLFKCKKIWYALVVYLL
jgi:hypothetical protein